MMPRFSLPSEAKTRKAERNEQNPATTRTLYTALSHDSPSVKHRRIAETPHCAPVHCHRALTNGPPHVETGILTRGQGRLPERSGPHDREPDRALARRGASQRWLFLWRVGGRERGYVGTGLASLGVRSHERPPVEPERRLVLLGQLTCLDHIVLDRRERVPLVHPSIDLAAELDERSHGYPSSRVRSATQREYRGPHRMNPSLPKSRPVCKSSMAMNRRAMRGLRDPRVVHARRVVREGRVQCACRRGVLFVSLRLAR